MGPIPLRANLFNNPAILEDRVSKIIIKAWEIKLLDIEPIKFEDQQIVYNNQLTPFNLDYGFSQKQHIEQKRLEDEKRRL